MVYPDRKATLCDSKLRTLNVDAQCGSDSDLWYYAPWRSPGLTPVNDACGTAGGRVAGQGQGSQVNFSIDAFLSFPNVALFNFFSFCSYNSITHAITIFPCFFFLVFPLVVPVTVSGTLPGRWLHQHFERGGWRPRLAASSSRDGHYLEARRARRGLLGDQGLAWRRVWLKHIFFIFFLS